MIVSAFVWIHPLFQEEVLMNQRTVFVFVFVCVCISEEGPVQKVDLGLVQCVTEVSYSKR